MEMNGKSSKIAESEGKGKAPSSEDLQEQISCPKEGTIVFEEANVPETKDAEGKEISESSSKDTQEKCVMEMDGKPSNNSESEGKGKAPSSEHLQEKISCPNEGAIVFEEANILETKDSKGKEISESSKDTQENMYPVVPADTIIISSLDLNVVFQDVNEKIPDSNEGKIIVQERKEVEVASNAKGKQIAAGSALNAQENILKEQTSELVSGLPEVDVGVSQMNDGCGDKIKRISYPCGFCTKMFVSAQALGGHQNSHREERAKRRKKSGEPNLSNSYPTESYTDYNLSFNRESLASPVPPVPNPRGSTQYPLGYFGRSMTMSFNDRQLLSYDRPRLLGPYHLNNDNINNAGCNSRGNNNGGFSQGRNDTYQDPGRSNDGTIDLLSRFGMGSGEDEKGDGDHGDNKTES